MKKKVVLGIMVLVIVAFSPVIYDGAKKNDINNHLQENKISIAATEYSNMVKMVISVKGDLPNAENHLNLFVDNNKLELMNPGQIASENVGVQFEGSYGPDHLFLLNNDFGGTISLYFSKKEEYHGGNYYAFIKTKIDPLYAEPFVIKGPIFNFWF